MSPMVIYQLHFEYFAETPDAMVILSNLNFKGNIRTYDVDAI